MHYTLPIILGLLVAAILVALIVGVAVSQGSNQSPGDLDYTNATKVAPELADSGSTEFTEDVRNTGCFDIDLEPTDCGTEAAYESAGGVTAEWECADSQIALAARSAEGTNYLCLNQAGKVAYRTCLTAEGEDWGCADGLVWRYEACWEAGGTFILQQRRPGASDWVDLPTPVSVVKRECSAEYPWQVTFTRRVSGSGERQYRLYSPPQDGYNAAFDYLTATTTTVP